VSGSQPAHQIEPFEHCECCQAFAPAWHEPEYADWQLELGEGSSYLGVVCSTCFVAEELVFAITPL
jgi:hypothetical protein